MPTRQLMGFLQKIETLINNLLILIGDLFVRALLRILSPKVRLLISRITDWFIFAFAWIKNFPALVIKSGPGLVTKIKSSLMTFNFKEKFTETYTAAIDQYKRSQPGAKFSGFKTVLLTPFLIMGQWLKGLTSAQAILLLGFTSASVLAGINMIFSGNRLMDQMKDGRVPASVEDEAIYERPDYYKIESRHLSITNLRLPVFFANVNELKSIDIDISATLSNRLSRLKLEKLEFELRDHLVLNIEPMLASFPLEDEGKDIIREKLLMEIQEFMTAQKIEGEVKDLKLIYILAN